MQGLRQAIAEDKLQDFTAQFYSDQAKGDIEEL
jgi:queuine/archaeosine tRNA-ribosyltransferase